MLLITNKIIIDSSTNQLLINLYDKSLILQVHGVDVSVKSDTLDTIVTFQSNNEAVEFVNGIYRKISQAHKISLLYKILKRSALFLACAGFIWFVLNIVSLMVVSRGFQPSTMPSASLSSVSREVSSENSLKSTLDEANLQPDQETKINTSELAAGLIKGIETGDYSINLSGRPFDKNAPALFVFSDPLCPHCQTAESTLRALAKEIPVYIFPVSLIGSTESEKIIIPILCKRDQARTDAWITQSTKDVCEEGKIALNTNNTFFKMAQFEGTPTLVASDGRIYNYANPLTVDALKKWVNK